MGKWSDNEKTMRAEVRTAIFKSLWDKINSKDPSQEQDIDNRAILENKIKKCFILKVVLGMLKAKNQKYEETDISKQFDAAIQEGDFEKFKEIVSQALYQSSSEKLLSAQNKSQVTVEDIETESDKTLAKIQDGEHLSLPLLDNANPEITQSDIDSLNEYMQEMGISAAVSITHNNQNFVLEPEKFGPNPAFSIHSVAKLFTGVLLMKMINDDIISKDDLDKPIQLDKEILKPLSEAVKERLAHVTLKQIMLHTSGLGDYLDNPGGYSAKIEEHLSRNESLPSIQNSRDLLTYGSKKVGPLGQFNYSNLGMLLLGFAIEKKYQEKQREKKETPLLTIDEIMSRFAKDVIKMQIFESKAPINGIFNSTKMRNQQGALVTTDSESIKKHVFARFGTTAGSYWTTNKDLQKFAKWISDECKRDPNFKSLFENYGGEFYNPKTQALAHSGEVHGDTAHFYTSLRNGTTITVLSDQGDRTASNLVDTILRQTSWYKSKLTSQNQPTATSAEVGSGRPRRISLAYDRAIATGLPSQERPQDKMEPKPRDPQAIPKLSLNDPKDSPNAPLIPCVKCGKTHRKNQCKG